MFSALQLMKLVKLSTKKCLNSCTPKNSKYMIQLNIKQILLNNNHSTNIPQTLCTGLHFSTANSSSSSMNVTERNFHYCSSTQGKTQSKLLLHTKQTSSLRCSTFFLRLVNISHRLHWPNFL